jgi:D-glycero-D-manno-heptose 1,7-bisphosphate phosphatase
MKEQKQNLKDLCVDETWTLFLDRDGVINQRIEDDYVRNWTQFKFLPSAVEALKRLSTIFRRIIVITNQRGIARNIIRDIDLSEIHRNMGESVRGIGGRIDRVYVCPHDMQDHCNCRKPKPGLALEAKKDFPSIVFSKSIMIGDDDSDMAFAKTLNMKSILINDENKNETQKVMADYVFKDLLEFALSL